MGWLRGGRRVGSLTHPLQVEVWGQLGEDVAGQLIHHLLLALASSPGLSGQGEQDAVKQLLCFLLVLRDVCILVQSKHFWVGYEWQGAQAVDVALVVSMGRGSVLATRREPVATTLAPPPSAAGSSQLTCTSHLPLFPGSRRWRGGRPATCGPSRQSHDHHSYTGLSGR